MLLWLLCYLLKHFEIAICIVETFLFRARYTDYCTENYANGHCDEGCNTQGCGWDGLDCEGDYPEQRADRVLVSDET